MALEGVYAQVYGIGQKNKARYAETERYLMRVTIAVTMSEQVGKYRDWYGSIDRVDVKTVWRPSVVIC